MKISASVLKVAMEVALILMTLGCTGREQAASSKIPVGFVGEWVRSDVEAGSQKDKLAINSERIEWVRWELDRKQTILVPQKVIINKDVVLLFDADIICAMELATGNGITRHATILIKMINNEIVMIIGGSDVNYGSWRRTVPEQTFIFNKV